VRSVIPPVPACRGTETWKGTCCCFLSIRSNEPSQGSPPSTCHPERTRISYFTALPAATYAALRKESRTKSTEATVFDRKSGGAEGSAVRPGSRTKVSLPLVLPQNRHPACPGLPWERSASQIDRLTEGFLRGVEEPVLSEVEGTSAVLDFHMLLGAFDHRSPTLHGDAGCW
jgi:hypothetical protein